MLTILKMLFLILRQSPSISREFLLRQDVVGSPPSKAPISMIFFFNGGLHWLIFKYRNSLEFWDKPTWSWCIILSICCWIWVANIFLRIFYILCLWEILHCGSLSLWNVSGFGFRVMLISFWEFGSILFSRRGCTRFVLFLLCSVEFAIEIIQIETFLVEDF